MRNLSFMNTVPDGLVLIIIGNLNPLIELEGQGRNQKIHFFPKIWRKFFLKPKSKMLFFLHLTSKVVKLFTSNQAW